jgi:hypothetical protein
MGDNKEFLRDKLIGALGSGEKVTSQKITEMMSIEGVMDVYLVSELMLDLLKKEDMTRLSFLLNEDGMEGFVIFARKTFVSNYFFSEIIKENSQVLKFYEKTEKSNFKVAWRLPHSGTMDYKNAKDMETIKRYEMEFFKHYAQTNGFNLYNGYTVLETATSYLIQNCESPELSREWVKIMKESKFKSFDEKTDLVGNILAMIKIFIRTESFRNKNGIEAIMSDSELTARAFKIGDGVLLKYCDVEGAMKRSPDLFV